MIFLIAYPLGNFIFYLLFRFYGERICKCWFYFTNFYPVRWKNSFVVHSILTMNSIFIWIFWHNVITIQVVSNKDLTNCVHIWIQKSSGLSWYLLSSTLYIWSKDSIRRFPALASIWNCFSLFFFQYFCNSTDHRLFLQSRGVQHIPSFFFWFNGLHRDIIKVYV